MKRKSQWSIPRRVIAPFSVFLRASAPLAENSILLLGEEVK